MGFHNYRPFLGLLLHATGVLLHVSVLLGPALSALLRAHTPLHTAALLLLPWLMLLTGRNLGGLHGEAEPEKWANLVERRDFRLVFLAVPWRPIPSVKYGEEEDSPVFSWYGKIQGRNTDTEFWLGKSGRGSRRCWQRKKD